MKKIFSFLGVALVALGAMIFASCSGSVKPTLYYYDATEDYGYVEDPELSFYFVYTESPELVEIIKALPTGDDIEEPEGEEEPVYPDCVVDYQLSDNCAVLVLTKSSVTLESIFPKTDLKESTLLGLDDGEDQENDLLYICLYEEYKEDSEESKLVSLEVLTAYKDKLRANGLDASLKDYEFDEEESGKVIAIKVSEADYEIRGDYKYISEEFEVKLFIAFEVKDKAYLVLGGK